ncbi:MAG: DMT family transporter [Paracoccaceae bacterium]|jgi:drug/metabolite transporter (DMT)-like permease|nr:MAG: DMT family transporter [Paracoccaceae bacterium]|tara:strand:+ start:1157 stop:2056 length:900 start_codon:yes stop_codon:yes gene_type:complete
MKQINSVTLGILFMLAFAIIGPLIDLFAKLASAEVPIGQIILSRFILQGFVLLPVAIILSLAHRPTFKEFQMHFLRATLILIGTGSFVSAIKYMPLADAMAIFFVEPFMVTLLGGFVLGETVGYRRLIACLIGFFGALFIIKPSFSLFGMVAFLPLLTAFSFTFYIFITRKMAQNMHPVTLQAYTALAAVIILLPIIIWANGTNIELLDPITPSLKAIFLLLGVGIAAIIAHLFITFALSMAPATIIAPLQYFEIVTATLFGYLFFSDFPDKWTFLGVFIIILSGVYVILREHKAQKIS